MSPEDKETAASLIKKANKLKREGKLSEAVAAYRRCIEISPKSPWPHHNLGEVLFESGAIDESIVAYREAIKLNPKSAWSYHNLATALVKKGSWFEAVNCSRRACELNSSYYEFYKGLAWPLKKQKKWDEAISAYSKAIALNPNDGEAYYWLGDIFKIQRRWQDAIKIYQQGLENLPENEELASKLQQLIKERNYAQKQQKLKKELSHYRTIAAEQKEAGNLEEAIAAYRQAVALEPNNLDYWQLGILLVETQQWEESLFCYEQLLAIQPWQNGQIKQCLSLGDLLVDRDKLNPEEHYLKLGNALRKQGKLLQALDWYGKAIQLNPSLVDKLELVFLKQGDLTNWQELKKIGYLEIYPESQTVLKKPVALNSTVNPGFFEVKNDKNASLIIVPEGRVWFNDPRSLAVISSDNEFVIKENYDGGHDFSVDSLNSENLLKIDGTVAFLSGQWGENNYFHWMFDVIAKIHLLQKSGINLNDIDYFVVNCYEKRFQKDTLNALGIAPQKIVESRLNSLVKAKSLIVPLSEIISPWSCEFLKRKLLPEKQEKKIEDCTRIYLSRKDASYRRVTNEEEVCEFLKKFGFRSVNLGTMPVAEQALLLAGAKVVVGPHGAGFTNLVFCNPGTKVVEFHTPISVRPWYHFISDRCGLEYYYLIGEEVGNGDYTMNLDLLSQLMKVLQL